MNLRQKKIAKKREEILRSAAYIVSRKGYHRSTMEDIAAELLMTKGSLYYYFDSKEELIFQCHELVLTSAIKTLKNISKEPIGSIRKLRKAIVAHIDFAINEKETFNMIIKPEHTFTEERLDPILEKRQLYAEIFDEIIQEGIDRGQFHHVETKMVRMIILGATNWIQQWYSPQGKRSKDEIAAIYSDYLLRMLE